MLLTDPSATSLGDWVGARKVRAYNRTGATLKKGQTSMIDIAQTQAETTSIVPGATGSVWSNVTPCTQIGVDCGFPVLVCADATIADNAVGWFWVAGPYVPVATTDDDANTTDVEIGGRIAILVSNFATSVEGWATAAAGGSAPNNSGGARSLGFSLEAGAASTDSSATQIDTSTHLRYCCWTGGLPNYGVSDT